MRNLVIALGAALTLTAAPALACSGSKVATNEAAPAANAAKVSDPSSLTQASFKVDGMSCAVSCPVQIKTALAGLSGVSEVAVNFEKKMVDVTYAAGEVTPERLLETINKLGYKAKANTEEAPKASAET